MRLYNIISFIYIRPNMFAGMDLIQRFVLCTNILIKIMFYIIVDCSKVLFDIIIMLVVVVFTKKSVHINILQKVNFLVEESYLHKPKIKILLFVKNVGVRINPNKKEFFNHTITKFKCLIENFSSDQIFNALGKDWLESNTKSNKLTQISVTTTIRGGAGEREHFGIVNNCGAGIITCTNPPVGIGFEVIGKTKYGKILYGFPFVRGENTSVAETNHKVSDSEAILFTKSTYQNITNDITYIETTAGSIKCSTLNRLKFVENYKLPETLMTPHFSNTEIDLIRRSGLYNDYFL